MGNNLLCGSVYGLRIGGGFEAQNVGSGVGSSKNGLYRIIMIIYSVEAEFIHLVGVDYGLRGHNDPYRSEAHFTGRDRTSDAARALFLSHSSPE